MNDIKKGDHVLIRDHMAGVHVGTLAALDPAAKTAELSECRKVWYWHGAASVHGIAARGLDGQSKVCPVVAHVVLCNVLEVVLCDEAGYSSVMDSKEWRP